MKQLTITQLNEFLQTKIDQCKILVLGDVMLDKYYFGEVKRISPEAPVPITRVTKQKDTLGGATNVAHNLARLGCQVSLCGVTGDDYHRKELAEKLAERGICYDGLICTAGPTTTKLRVIGGHQQMLRLDFEEMAPIVGAEEQRLLAYVSTQLQAGVDGVIISDYAKGVCTPEICQAVIAKCVAAQIPVVVDPKGNAWQKYSGVDYITPNLKELNEVTALKVDNDDEAVKKVAQAVKRKYKIKNMIVTRSEKGLSLIAARKTVHIPTLAQEVFDVSGAGDTVIAVFCAALSGKIEPAAAAYLANLAASVVVAKLGTYAISKEELIAALSKNKK